MPEHAKTSIAKNKLKANAPMEEPVRIWGENKCGK